MLSKVRMDETNIRTNISSSSKQERVIATLFRLLDDFCANLIICYELMTDDV